MSFNPLPVTEYKEMSELCAAGVACADVSIRPSHRSTGRYSFNDNLSLLFAISIRFSYLSIGRCSGIILNEF